MIVDSISLVRLVNLIYLVLRLEEIVAPLGIFGISKAGINEIRGAIPNAGIVHMVVLKVANTRYGVPPHSPAHQVVGLGKAATHSTVFAVDGSSHHSRSGDTGQWLYRVIVPVLPFVILGLF